MKLPILTEPNDVLLRRADEIKVFGSSVAELAEAMLETMHAAGGIGLAGPQVGAPLRIVVLEKCPNDLVMCNPIITDASDRSTGWHEQCLSCPGKRVWVLRPKWIFVEWQNADGTAYSARFSQLMARCIQHEIDHLDGKLITS